MDTLIDTMIGSVIGLICTAGSIHVNKLNYWCTWTTGTFHTCVIFKSIVTRIRQERKKRIWFHVNKTVFIHFVYRCFWYNTIQYKIHLLPLVTFW